MNTPKVPDRKFVTESAARLTLTDVATAVGSTEAISRKLAAARGRFARQEHKLELLGMVVREGLAGTLTDWSEADIKIAGFPFCYLLDSRDLIPDTVPVAGFSDDLAAIVVAWGILEDKLKAFADSRGLLFSRYFDINQSD